jgi:GNAT superfamily N-acetyltransferase
MFYRAERFSLNSGGEFCKYDAYFEGKSMQWQRPGFLITDQRETLDDDLIYQFLSTESYWAKGIPKATVVRSLDHSLCFGLFEGQQQIGFGRIITDRATFAYLADIFVLASHRGQELGQWLVEYILSHPDLQGLRRWMLATGDAHDLYRRYGFELSQPGSLMERLHHGIYSAQQKG